MTSFQQAINKTQPQEPNLWKEQESQKKEVNLSAATIVQIQDFLTKVTRKLGNDLHELKPHDFEFSFTPGLPVDFKIMGGPRVLVLFSVIPFESKFDEVMRRALSLIKSVKRSTDIDTLARIQERAIPQFTLLTVHPSEIHVECLRIVRVVHKATGLMSVKSADLVRGKSVRALVAEARADIGETLHHLGIAREMHGNQTLES
jgi:hypothetical protein